MSATRYKIQLWKYDGETSDASTVTFDSFAEAEARFNDLQVSEEMPCVEFIKERIANGRIIGDEVLNVRKFTLEWERNGLTFTSRGLYIRPKVSQPSPYSQRSICADRASAFASANR